MGRFATAAEFEQWVRTEMKAGRPVDALRPPYIEDEVERFWSRVQAGADHDYWRGAWYFERNDGRTQHARRWLLERHLERKLVVPHDVVDVTCGEARCIRLRHLSLRARGGEAHAPMTQSDAIWRIRAAVRDMGHLPTRREWQEARMPRGDTLRRLFGSVEAAIAAAGYEPRSPTHGLYTDDDLREAIRERERELGHRPTKSEWVAAGWLPSYHTIQERLGGLRKALPS